MDSEESVTWLPVVAAADTRSTASSMCVQVPLENLVMDLRWTLERNSFMGSLSY